MTTPYSAPKDTLQYQLGARPMTQRLDFSSSLMTDVMESFNAHPLPVDQEVYGLPKPESEALWFYLLNHAVSEVRKVRHPQEPLGDLLPILTEYHKQLAPRAVRLFRYLMLICTREARHSKNQLHWNQPHGQSQAAMDYIRTEVCGKGSDGAAYHVQHEPPEGVTVGEYVMALRHVFYEGEWGKQDSVSYGGKAWGSVTDCLVEFVFGRYSAEMMMDTGWTLCHNGGPIFNKGMLYECYEHSAVNMILDVQRSGQIPQLILEAMTGGSTQDLKGYVTASMETCLTTTDHLLGGRLLGPTKYVDWYQVEALGGLHSWSSKQVTQAKKYGLPAGLAEKQAQAAKLQEAKDAKVKAEALAAQQKHQELLANSYEVWPGELVQKKKMERAA